MRDMFDLLLDVWRFVMGQASHPLIQRELAGWNYLRPWRALRRGCLPVMLITVVTTVGCCGLSIAAGASTSSEDMLLVVFSTLAGLFIGAELINFASGLIATALTATTLSGDVEAGRLEMLRVTPLTAREIVLAKFGAVMRQLRLPLATVAVLRAIFLIAVVLMLFAAVGGEQVNAGSPGASEPLAPSLALGLLVNGLFLLATALLWLLYYLLQPFLRTALFAALGVFASAYSRTRAGGLFTAAGFRVGYFVVAYIASQAISLVFTLVLSPITLLMSAAPMLPPWLETLLNQPVLLIFAVILVMAVSLVLAVAWPVCVTLATLSWTIRRTQSLPYG